MFHTYIDFIPLDTKYCQILNAIYLGDFFFFKDVSYAHQGCIYFIKNIVKHLYCEILLQFK